MRINWTELVCAPPVLHLTGQQRVSPGRRHDVDRSCWCLLWMCWTIWLKQFVKLLIHLTLCRVRQVFPPAVIKWTHSDWGFCNSEETTAALMQDECIRRMFSSVADKLIRRISRGVEPPPPPACMCVSFMSSAFMKSSPTLKGLSGETKRQSGGE